MSDESLVVSEVKRVCPWVESKDIDEWTDEEHDQFQRISQLMIETVEILNDIPPATANPPTKEWRRLNTINEPKEVK